MDLFPGSLAAQESVKTPHPQGYVGYSSAWWGHRVAAQLLNLSLVMTWKIVPVVGTPWPCNDSVFEKQKGPCMQG